MGTTLFVGGLAGEVDEDTLQRAFGEYGKLTEARVIKDRHTGKNRGFGFVSFEDQADADKAIQEMDGFDLLGSCLRVRAAHDQKKGSEKHPREPRSPEVLVKRGGMRTPKRESLRRVWERSVPKRNRDSEDGG